MSNNQNDWQSNYFQKTLAGLTAQKNKVDVCINWLLALNIGLLAVIFINITEYSLTIMVSVIGILLTWMIMLRSCRAWRQLINYDFILKRLHDYQYHPCNSLIIDRLFYCLNHLDYPDKSENSVYLTSRWQSFRKNLTQEYGLLIAIYVVIITYQILQNPRLINILWIGLLISFLILAFFGMFYKKESKPDRILSQGLEESKFKVPLGLGDLYDRLSILELKENRLNMNVTAYKASIKECIRQYRNLGIKPSTEDISVLIDINSKIWDLEELIQHILPKEIGFKEIGKNTYEIRKLNNKRISLRNKINRQTGTGYLEPTEVKKFQYKDL